MLKLYFLLAFLPLLSTACYLYNVDYQGSNLNADHSLKTSNAAACQDLCFKDSRCFFWSWISTQFSDVSYHRDCYLKPSDVYITSRLGVISGPKNCGEESCCDRINLDSIGMGDFYQGQRLGDYFKIGNSEEGRNIYQQVNGPNFLYYLSQRGYWMVGHTIGQDLGGLLNRGTGFCPENSSKDWEYWADWMAEWKQDSSMEAKCKNGDKTLEACAVGSVCDDCNVWAEVNGVKYCCAENCDYGYINVENVNGVVVCDCQH